MGYPGMVEHYTTTWWCVFQFARVEHPWGTYWRVYRG